MNALYNWLLVDWHWLITWIVLGMAAGSVKRAFKVWSKHQIAVVQAAHPAVPPLVQAATAIRPLRHCGRARAEADRMPALRPERHRGPRPGDRRAARLVLPGMRPAAPRRLGAQRRREPMTSTAGQPPRLPGRRTLPQAEAAKLQLAMSRCGVVLAARTTGGRVAIGSSPHDRQPDRRAARPYLYASPRLARTSCHAADCAIGRWPMRPDRVGQGRLSPPSRRPREWVMGWQRSMPRPAQAMRSRPKRGIACRRAAGNIWGTDQVWMSAGHRAASDLGVPPVPASKHPSSLARPNRNQL